MATRTQTIDSYGPEDTRAAGRRVGQEAQPNTIVTVDGELGAGKTVFARGVAEGLDVDAWRGSPTFNLVHEYSGRLPLFHVDAYRISGEELLDLDFSRLVDANGVIVVEWADNVAAALRQASNQSWTRVRISTAGDDRRRIEMKQ